ncbi:MAG: hypothetical protein KIT26_11295 [Nitrosomonas sp.]|nr:hypothetical protein [Nitrosomonas sp.]
MKLLELKIEPSGLNGWGSRVLEFGKDITQLYGPNGCGKTPIIHSIAYALGYPVRYREDILNNCESVILKAAHGDINIEFKRKIGSDFHLECIQSDQDEVRIFYNEKDMSTYLFNLLELSTSTLTSNRNEPTPPYISTFLPLFYVDQDSGYSSAYKPPTSFIKDQYAEMVRLSLGVPAKNSYERKRLLIEKKDELKRIDAAIVSNERFIERMMNERIDSGRTSQQLEHELERLRNELDELRSNQDATDGAESAINYLIQEKTSRKRELDRKIRDLEERLSGFGKIKNEIEVEINTLSLNEEARRLFTSFNDICANSRCQLFLNSSESYGKNLLYLRDQIKDLERNTHYQEARLDELRLQSKKLGEEIEMMKESQSSENPDNSTDGLVNASSRLTRSIIDIQSEKEIIERIEAEKSNYFKLQNQREKLHNDIAAMDSGGASTDFRLLEFRTEFKEKLKEWLDILSTRNVSRDISIDADFGVLFGSEKVSQFSGSTLLRVVLALKAAFFDIYISKGAQHIGFMIFDTPRQHDIEAEHFAAFIQRLKDTIKDRPCQVVFSTTEYHYDSQEHDVEWVPSFPGKEQYMFLGVLEKGN